VRNFVLLRLTCSILFLFAHMLKILIADKEVSGLKQICCTLLHVNFCIFLLCDYLDHAFLYDMILLDR